MRVAVAGGHGKIALALTPRLVAGGDEVVSLIRNPDHGADVRALGGEPVACDLELASEDEVAQAIAGCQAVVFAAGAGAGSGPARKETMDYAGAVKLIAAARTAGVPRYVMVSAIGARDPGSGSEAMRPYLEAKAEADATVASSGLAYTIVRPGGLTDDPGTGRVRAAVGLEPGMIPRDDVAATLVAVLDDPGTVGRSFDLVSGDEEIAQALRRL